MAAVRGFDVSSVSLSQEFVELLPMFSCSLVISSHMWASPCCQVSIAIAAFTQTFWKSPPGSDVMQL